MNVALFTDRNSVEKRFEPVRRSRSHVLQCFPRSELKKRVKGLEQGTFIYIDIAVCEDEERNRLLAYLGRLRGFRYGIIDTEGKIKDVASLLHSGASDYLNRDLLHGGMSVRRLNRAVSLHTSEADLGTPSAGTLRGQAIISSGSDWSAVRAGQEYTFGMMYIELDGQSRFKNKLSDAQLNSLMNSFKRYIECAVAPLKGMIWIWNDFGGLILFPFDGKMSEAPVVCLRLMLARKIFSVEETGLDMIFSYRIAFHIGNTVYKRKGNTGTIVSKSINTIFHLGQKYLHEGQFYITEEAFRFTPEGLKKTFSRVGNYEGHDILRMKLPL